MQIVLPTPLVHSAKANTFIDTYGKANSVQQLKVNEPLDRANFSDNKAFNHAKTQANLTRFIEFLATAPHNPKALKALAELNSRRTVTWDKARQRSTLPKPVLQFNLQNDGLIRAQLQAQTNPSTAKTVRNALAKLIQDPAYPVGGMLHGVTHYNGGAKGALIMCGEDRNSCHPVHKVLTATEQLRNAFQGEILTGPISSDFSLSSRHPGSWPRLRFTPKGLQMAGAQSMVVSKGQALGQSFGPLNPLETYAENASSAKGVAIKKFIAKQLDHDYPPVNGWLCSIRATEDPYYSPSWQSPLVHPQN
jgi:hypothetical protein